MLTNCAIVAIDANAMAYWLAAEAAFIVILVGLTVLQLMRRR